MTDRIFEGTNVGHPIPFEKFCKIRGDLKRHIEQLWDEIQKLKYRVEILERKEWEDKYVCPYCWPEGFLKVKNKVLSNK